jgi:hypothetical protein
VGAGVILPPEYPMGLDSAAPVGTRCHPWLQQLS